LGGSGGLFVSTTWTLSNPRRLTMIVMDGTDLPAWGDWAALKPDGVAIDQGTITSTAQG